MHYYTAFLKLKTPFCVFVVQQLSRKH